FGIQALLDPGGNLVTASQANSSGGKVVVQRWEGNKPTVIAESERVAPGFSVDNLFVTPDGTYWCAGVDLLCRLIDGKWTHVGTADIGYPRRLRAVGDGPPWLIAASHGLFRLDPGTRTFNAQMTPVALSPELGTVHDVLAWDKGQLLLA